MRKRSLWLGLILLAAGCVAKNPVTGKKEISLYSDRDEIRLGQQAAPTMIQQSGGLYRDAELSAYVDEVGQKLAAASDRPRIPPHDASFRYQFHVLNHSMVNAFALPGGQVFVTRGILSRLSDESELACVLGHEVGHVCAKHGVHHMQQALGMELLISLGAAAVQIKNPEQAGVDEIAGLARVGAQAVQMKYSRDDETQSDELGMKYAAKAGWDPRAMVRVQEVLKALETKEPGAIESLFRSHPMSDDRIRHSNGFLTRQFAGTDLGALATGKERYLQKTARLRATESAYARHDQGAKAMEPLASGQVKADSEEGRKAAREAHAAFAEAIRIDPAQPLFHAAQGKLYLIEGLLAESERSLQEALRLDGEAFEPRLLYGIHQFKSRRFAPAREQLARAAAISPAHPAPHYYLGRVSEEEGNRNEAARCYERAVAAGPDTFYGQDAKKRLDALTGPRLR